MLLSKMKDGLIGLSVGDALGVPVKFCTRDTLRREPVKDMRAYGTFVQPAGTWSFSTAATLAVMDSLVHGFSPADMLKRLNNWEQKGAYTPYGQAFDEGKTTHLALERFRSGADLQKCGGARDSDNEDSALTRMLPLAFWLYPQAGVNLADSASALEMIRQAVVITHAHPRSYVACVFFVCIAECLLAGMPVHSAVRLGVLNTVKGLMDGPEVETLNSFTRLADVDTFRFLSESEFVADGDAAHTLEAALYCLLSTDSYAACVRKAVSLGQSTDTTAATAGALAGIAYGQASIPAAWRLAIPGRGEMEELCGRLYDQIVQ